MFSRAREEAGTVNIPVVQEIMVVEKRQIVREKVRITRTRSVEEFERAVLLRTLVADSEPD